MSASGEVIFAVLAFFWGASWGSFANVVAWRLPEGRSIVRPSSACPACGAPIRWYHNLPVLGWLLLRGRCADCGVGISVRYPLVELTTGALALAFWLLLRAETPVPADFMLDAIVPFVLHVLFIAALVVLTLIDLDWFLLPDRLTLPLVLLGLLAAVASPRPPDALGAALGVAVGGLVPAVIMWAWLAATGRDGLGGGDWKLLAGIGAWLGVEAVPFVLGAGAIQGLVVALAFRRDFAVAELPPLPGEADPEGDAPGAEAEVAPEEAAPTPFMRLAVPFGPFLALAAAEWLLFGRDILAAVTR
jgi:leader peptidase (prepilin peptidase)/N-methyltransferase